MQIKNIYVFKQLVDFCTLTSADDYAHCNRTIVRSSREINRAMYFFRENDLLDRGDLSTRNEEKRNSKYDTSPPLIRKMNRYTCNCKVFAIRRFVEKRDFRRSSSHFENNLFSRVCDVIASLLTMQSISRGTSSLFTARRLSLCTICMYISTTAGSTVGHTARRTWRNIDCHAKIAVGIIKTDSFRLDS